MSPAPAFRRSPARRRHAAPGVLSPLPALLVALLLLAVPARGQEIRRPVPDPVVPPEGYRAAVEAGTRTAGGAPGSGYWQQWTDYRIEARLLTDSRRLLGEETIRYHNASPDTLRDLHLHVHQNLHVGGTVRNSPEEVTGGIDVDRVTVDGTALREAPSGDRPGWDVTATILEVRPPSPVAPGETVELELTWSFPVAKSTTGRGGWDDGLFFIGYWYPRMAVYDDVVGWQTDPFLGQAEFYDGFGSYEVTLEVPEGWVVRATGRLRNAREVFPPDVRRRLAAADGSDTVVHVLAPGDFGPGAATLDAEDDLLRWRFTADTVRDFAFSATRRARWDAARTPVGDPDGDGRTDYARVESVWRSTAPPWEHTWRYAQDAIAHHSRYTGIPYPWPHMTAVEGGGIIGGGMEYPMMTLMGDYVARGDSALYWVTAHELAHMWVPMIVSTDEKRYAWMDEGTTTYNENAARKDFFGTERGEVMSRSDYLETARSGDEMSMMTWGDYYHSGAYGTASYAKPATLLVTLRGLLGEETFLRAFRTFMAEWRYRHPYPWDLFRTFERVSGRDLGWFWRSWYYETWTLDQAVAGVERDGRRVTVTVRDEGNVPMPVRLRVTPEGGEPVDREVGVQAWLDGARTAGVTLELPPEAADRPLRVEIDPEHLFPDMDREDNTREVRP